MADEYLTNDQLTAYHEIGHAIAAMELQIQIGFISMEPNKHKGTLGSVEVEGDDGFFDVPLNSVRVKEEDGSVVSWAEALRRSKDVDDVLRRVVFSPEHEAAADKENEMQAIVDYAAHATLVALGIGDMSHESAVANGAEDDYEKAHGRLRGDHELIEKAKARALEIVTSRMDDIQKILHWLLERKRLDPQQVDMILAHDDPDYFSHLPPAR